MTEKPLDVEAIRALIVACEDCGLPYADFPLDVVLPDDDWLAIHPTGDGGLLCARCIAARAAKLPHMIVVFAQLVPNHRHEAFRAIKNVPMIEIAGLKATLTAETQARQQAERERDEAWRRLDAQRDCHKQLAIVLHEREAETRRRQEAESALLPQGMHLAELQQEKWRLERELAASEQARAQLRTALLEVERHCPCGARPESPRTHPHVIGCPVGDALAASPAPIPDEPTKISR